MLRFGAVMAAALLLLTGTAHANEGGEKATKSGIDLSFMDTSVKPQDDFYRYVNGKWLDTTEIPADKSIFSSFTELADQNDQRIRQIIEEAAQSQAAPGTPLQQVGDFYKAFMDTETLQKLGHQPIQEWLDRIDATQTHDDLTTLMAQLLEIGISSTINAGIGVDAKNATQYTVYLSQSGLGLPDREYYLQESEKMGELRAAYTAHITRMFTLLGKSDAAQRAQAIMDLETRIARNQWDNVQNRDSDKTYNPFTQAQLAKEAPGFNWPAYFRACQLGDNDLVVRQPSYAQAFAGMFAEVSVADWQTYLTWRLLNNFAGLLSSPFQDADFDFYERTLSGQQQQRPRWKRAVGAENRILGMLVGKIYVEKYFRPEAKQRMEELVGHLKHAFSQRLDQLDWMSAETKQAAHAKLAKFTAKIGYPDKWRDYSSLEIRKDDLVGNYLRASKAEHAYDLKRLGQPIDRDEWFMPPQTVNAYYSSSRNEIVFPAAILQPPFFDLDADMAANYGGIGSVIGHEITHGFDDQGRKSDGDGNLRDWWTEADASEFDKRARLMVDQYSTYKPLPDVHVNGELTLGENIADLGGLTMAYYAYKHSLEGKPSPVIDGFTGEQRLFLAWGQAWRRKYREAALRQRLATDTHSPGEYRAIGPTTNMPEFYEAFDVKPGDRMHRDPAVRIKIW